MTATQTQPDTHARNFAEKFTRRLQSESSGPGGGTSYDDLLQRAIENAEDLRRADTSMPDRSAAELVQQAIDRASLAFVKEPDVKRIQEPEQLHRFVQRHLDVVLGDMESLARSDSPAREVKGPRFQWGVKRDSQQTPSVVADSERASPAVVRDNAEQFTHRLKSENLSVNGRNAYEDLLSTAADSVKILRRMDESIPERSAQELVQQAIDNTAQVFARDANYKGIRETGQLHRAVERHLFDALDDLEALGRGESPNRDLQQQRAKWVMDTLRKQDPHDPDINFAEKIKDDITATYHHERQKRGGPNSSRSMGMTVSKNESRLLMQRGVEQFVDRMAARWEDFENSNPAPHRLFLMVSPFAEKQAVNRARKQSEVQVDGGRT